jgi:hypothetical protein
LLASGERAVGNIKADKISGRKKMKRLGISILFVAVLGLAGLAFLSSWKIPAPAHMVTKELANERFQK